MRQLLQFPPGDLVSCKNWSSLKDAVSTALMDRNTELAVSAATYYHPSLYSSSLLHLSLCCSVLYVNGEFLFLFYWGWLGFESEVPLSDVHVSVISDQQHCVPEPG